MNNLYKIFFKRVLDIIFSLISLVFLLILFIPISLLIFLEDKGPVFYNAPRLGKNGKIFKMYKFRTMKVNAPDIRNKDGSTYNDDNDPRLTKIGKILRKTSIDELPQLINVLIGDMSLIGPRPDLPEHEKLYTNEEKRKLDVLPGITGYNQAYYRNSIEWKDRLKNDVYYVDHISFILDIKIIFKTFFTVFFQEGIFIKNSKYDVQNLEWDSNYFGFPCGKVILNEEINEKDIKIIKKEIKKFKFITISNLNNNYTNNKLIETNTSSYLTDINVQLEKKVSLNDVHDKSIVIDNNVEKDRRMLDIAKDSFIYSRFYNDKNLNKEKSKKMYYNWLKNAFNDENKYICSYNKDNNVLGFILFHIDKVLNCCVIELVAVNKLNEKKGIGTIMIQSVENFCNKNELNFMKVGTQLENIKAQNFYIKNGFKIQSYNSIFHCWR